MEEYIVELKSLRDGSLLQTAKITILTRNVLQFSRLLRKLTFDWVEEQSLPAFERVEAQIHMPQMASSLLFAFDVWNGKEFLR